MRVMPTAVSDAFKAKTLAGSLAPSFTFNVATGGGGTNITDVIYLRIAQSLRQRCATATVVLANPIVSDGGQTGGKYAPDRSLGTYAGVLKLGRRINISTGYGANKVTSFAGLIDDIRMTRTPRGVPLLTIEARDLMARLVKQKIRDTAAAFPNNLSGSLTATTPEAVFDQLCIWAGFTGSPTDVGYDASGVTAYKFAWENMWGEPGLAALEAITGFHAYCDADGVAQFRDISLGVTTAVYEEGGDPAKVGRLTEIDYALSWRDIHNRLLFIAEQQDGTVISSTYNYGAIAPSVITPLAEDTETYLVRDGKLDNGAAGQTDLDTAAAEYGARMAANLRRVMFRGPAIPWHQLGDVVQVVESSTTASQTYRVDAITLEWGREIPFLQTLECHFYA